MVDEELSKTVQLDVVPVLSQMRYECVLQARYTCSKKCFRFVLRTEPERSPKALYNLFFSTFPLGRH